MSVVLETADRNEATPNPNSRLLSAAQNDQLPSVESRKITLAGEGSVGAHTQNEEGQRQATLAERVANALNDEYQYEDEDQCFLQSHMFEHESPAFQTLKLKIMQKEYQDKIF